MPVTYAESTQYHKEKRCFEFRNTARVDGVGLGTYLDIAWEGFCTEL